MQGRQVGLNDVAWQTLGEHICRVACGLNLPGVDCAIRHFVLDPQILHINVPGSAETLSVRHPESSGCI